MPKVSAKRHIAKAVTWRIVGTLDTICISWLVSGDWAAGLTIGFAELMTKMALYYFHERVWYRIKYLADRSRLRHTLKTITWRFIGTIDTIILSWIVTKRADYSLYIGGFEVLSKMILYYLHERLWYRNRFGVSEENND